MIKTKILQADSRAQKMIELVEKMKKRDRKLDEKIVSEEFFLSFDDSEKSQSVQSEDKAEHL